VIVITTLLAAAAGWFLHRATDRAAVEAIRRQAARDGRRSRQGEVDDLHRRILVLEHQSRRFPRISHANGLEPGVDR
jgi:hypothetical protein